MQLPIRVMLVDDNLDFLRSAKNFLKLIPALQLISSVTTGQEALDQIPTLMPNLVLMDWAMPELSGLETTRRIKARKDAPRVVILTIYNFPQYRKAAQSAGADGFISKSDWIDQLIPIIQNLFFEPDSKTNNQEVFNLKIQVGKNSEPGRIFLDLNKGGI
jgi:two-component system response regulator NreC